MARKITDIKKTIRFPKEEPYEGDLAWGEFCMLNLEDLVVEEDKYQRDGIHRNDLLKMYREFNPCMVGTLIVGINGDRFRLIDGQHRALAMLARGIKRAPCIVHYEMSLQDRAKEFVGLNTRSPLNSLEKYNGRVHAGDKREVEVQRWLKSVGMCMGTASMINGIAFIAAFLKRWDKDKRACKEAVALAQAVSGDAPIKGRIHGGFWYLLRRGVVQGEKEVDIAEYISALKKAGGADGIEGSYQALVLKYRMSSTNSSEVEFLYGAAILEILNRKRRNRFTFKPDPKGIFGRSRVAVAV